MFVGVFAVALWALPVQAEMVSVGDSELSAISGKADGRTSDNTNTGAGNLLIGADASNGNIQVGYYQWNDNHSTDASTNKGGNNQSGATSAVQQNVVAETNAISWGAFADASYISSGNVVDNGVDQESWSTLFIGGF